MMWNGEWQVASRISDLGFSRLLGRLPVLLHNNANVGPMCYSNSADNAMRTDAL